MDDLAGPADRLQADPVVGVALAAEAEPPFAAVADPAQLEAEVAGIAAADGGQTVELGKGHRCRRADTEDQAAPCLGELRLQQVGATRIVRGAAGARHRARRHGGGEDDRAKDLASWRDRRAPRGPIGPASPY